MGICVLRNPLNAQEAGQEGRRWWVYGNCPVSHVVTGTGQWLESWREANGFEIHSGARPFVRGEERSDLSFFSDFTTVVLKYSVTFPLEVKLSHRIRMMWPFLCEGGAAFSQTRCKMRPRL